MKLETATQKVFFNTFVQIGGKTVTTILSLFTVAAITRYLGVSQFGEYTTAFAYMMFFGVIADFGFFTILVREISRGTLPAEKVANNILTMRTIGAFVLYALGALVVFFLPYSANVKEGVVILAFASFVLSINSTMVGIFQARQRMDFAVVGDILGRGLILTLILYFITHGAGLAVIFWTAFWGNLLNLAVSTGFSWRYVRLKPAFDWALWRVIFHEAWPLGISFILGSLYFKIDTVILSIIRPAVDVGIYGAAYKILEILALVPGIFMGTIFPFLSRYSATSDERLGPMIQRSFDFLAITGLGVVAGLVVLARPIIHLIAGDSFVNAATVHVAGVAITTPITLQILAISVGVIFVANLFAPIIIAHGQQKKMIIPSLIATVFNVILNLILIPRWGYAAAAATTFLTELLILILWARIAHRAARFSLQFGTFWKAVLGALLMGLALVFLSGANLFLLIILGATIYFGFLFLTGGLTLAMLGTFFKKGGDQ